MARMPLASGKIKLFAQPRNRSCGSDRSAGGVCGGRTCVWVLYVCVCATFPRKRGEMVNGLNIFHFSSAQNTRTHAHTHRTLGASGMAKVGRSVVWGSAFNSDVQCFSGQLIRFAAAFGIHWASTHTHTLTFTKLFAIQYKMTNLTHFSPAVIASRTPPCDVRPVRRDRTREGMQN